MFSLRNVPSQSFQHPPAYIIHLATKTLIRFRSLCESRAGQVRGQAGQRKEWGNGPGRKEGSRGKIFSCHSSTNKIIFKMWTTTITLFRELK